MAFLNTGSNMPLETQRFSQWCEYTFIYRHNCKICATFVRHNHLSKWLSHFHKTKSHLLSLLTSSVLCGLCLAKYRAIYSHVYSLCLDDHSHKHHLWLITAKPGTMHQNENGVIISVFYMSSASKWCIITVLGQKLMIWQPWFGNVIHFLVHCLPLNIIVHFLRMFKCDLCLVLPCWVFTVLSWVILTPHLTEIPKLGHPLGVLPVLLCEPLIPLCGIPWPRGWKGTHHWALCICAAKAGLSNFDIL
jgi:hypothetical protein